jgi:hypothetical protein
VAPLGVGKHPELRRAAERTLAVAHAHVSAAAVADAIAAQPPDARTALLRGLQARAPHTSRTMQHGFGCGPADVGCAREMVLTPDAVWSSFFVQAHLPAPDDEKAGEAAEAICSAPEMVHSAAASWSEAAPSTLTVAAAPCASSPVEAAEEPDEAADADDSTAEETPAAHEAEPAAEPPQEPAGENYAPPVALPSPKPQPGAASPNSFQLSSPLGDISNHASPAAQPPLPSIFATPAAAQQQTPAFLAALSRYATPPTVAPSQAFPSPGAAEAYVEVPIALLLLALNSLLCCPNGH